MEPSERGTKEPISNNELLKKGLIVKLNKEKRKKNPKLFPPPMDLVGRIRGRSSQNRAFLEESMKLSGYHLYL